MPTEYQVLEYNFDDPMRLDRYLNTLFPTLSRAYIQQLIEKNLFKVNTRLPNKGTSLKKGDQIILESFVLPHERCILPNINLPIQILHEENDFLVLDKPAGCPTHPNEFLDTSTVANFLVGKFPSILGVGDEALRPGIVHRLDNNTSGLLLAAKNQEGFLKLRSLFDERKIKKTYVALVLGQLKREGEIDYDVAHHPDNPRKMIAVKTGKEEIRSRLREARTMFRPLQVFENATLVEVKTLTGRMHQVRVHMAALGFPLVGDKLYQERKQQNVDKFGLLRHFLHASHIIVPYQDDAPALEFTSPLAPELQDLIAKL